MAWPRIFLRLPSSKIPSAWPKGWIQSPWEEIALLRLIKDCILFPEIHLLKYLHILTLFLSLLIMLMSLYLWGLINVRPSSSVPLNCLSPQVFLSMSLSLSLDRNVPEALLHVEEAGVDIRPSVLLCLSPQVFLSLSLSLDRNVPEALLYVEEAGVDVRPSICTAHHIQTLK